MFYLSFLYIMKINIETLFSLTSKFWTRNRPGDRMQDKYNLNTLPKGMEDCADYGMPWSF